MEIGSWFPFEQKCSRKVVIRVIGWKRHEWHTASMNIDGWYEKCINIKIFVRRIAIKDYAIK